MTAIVDFWRLYGLAVAAHGWRAIPIKPASKAPVFKDWPRAGVPTAEECARYQRWGNYGLGIPVAGRQGDGFVVPVDIDVYDPALVAMIKVEAIKTLGKAPERVGRPPKLLLPYRCPDPIGKLATAGYRLPGDAKDAPLHRVEILKTQFVAYGQHPCGRDYAWSGGSPATMTPGDLPVVTLAKLKAFLSACEAILRGAGGLVVSAAVDRQGGSARHCGPLNLAQYAGVFALSKALGHVIGDAAPRWDGPWFKTLKVAIRCPFADEHPNRGDTGCALLPEGGVKCHHTTCEGRRTKDFIEKLKELAHEDGLDGDAIYAEGYTEIVRRGFALADDDALARLRCALFAADAAAIDEAAAGVRDVWRPRVLDFLDGTEAVDIAGTARVRNSLDAADAEDDMRVARWAPPPVEQQSEHQRLVARAAWAARKARTKRMEWDRLVEAGRQLAARSAP